MKVHNLHRWAITPRQAIEVQKRLRRRVLRRGSVGRIRTVAGCDVAFDEERNRVIACLVIFDAASLTLQEKITASCKLTFPYVPGLLTFREGPAVLAGFRKLAARPDVVLFDGQGICHPRRMGLASHMGLLLDLPSVGCAKSPLFGSFSPPGRRRGSRSPIRDGREVIGAVVRTRTGVKPVYVSTGHRVSLDQAIRLVLACSPKYRIPEPLRWAHHLVTREKKNLAPC